IAGLSLLAALPLSFFFNGNLGDWFGNLPLDIIPPPEELPEGWENWDIPGDFNVPDLPWGDMELPEGFQDWFDNLPQDWNGELPPGEIPWWLAAGALAYLLAGGELPGGGGIGDIGGDLGGAGGGSDSGWDVGGVGGLPGMGGSMGAGLGPFGTGNTTVWVSSNQAWRYWRLRGYDWFSGYTWLISDNTTIPYQWNDVLGINYTVIFRVEYNEPGYGNLPLPTLWNRPMIYSGFVFLNETGLPAQNVTWELIEDPYGNVFWNATIGNAGIYYLGYNVTFDNTITKAMIESNVYSQSPLNFVADAPGTQDYLQLPMTYLQANASAVLADMQALASNPAITTNNTYETAKAVMEYFKMNWWWTPYRYRIPGKDFDPMYLMNYGYGTSADFASNYVMYLRYMNISSRLVWGGVGYQDDLTASAQFGMPLSRLSHSHFWAEVWIPNATNTGGEWVQFDPSPIPPTMWQPNATNPNQLIEINTQRYDDRVETAHYKMLLTSSVNYDAPQNRGNSFTLNGNLLRDGTTLTKTWLGEAVQYDYIDVTEKTLVGQNLGPISYAFDANSRVGPHRFNSTFHSIVNETVVTCNGTSQVVIENLDPHLIERGLDDFIVTGNASDASNNKPLFDVGLHGWIVDAAQEIPDNLGPQVTDINGLVNTEYTFPSSLTVGTYNFTMNFTGNYIIDYPDPYPDYPVSIPSSASQSTNETLTVTVGTNITLLTSGAGDYIPRSHNITFSGTLWFDNGTAAAGVPVKVWWVNSSGIYNIVSDITAGDGTYQGNYFIPTLYNDPSNNNDIYLYANFTAGWGNGTTDPTHVYHVRGSNTTSIVLNTDINTFQYVIREQTNIHVWGHLSDTHGVASTAGQNILIVVYETQELVDSSIITDANGNFDTIIQIPNTQNVGQYNLCAVFPGVWSYGFNIPSSLSVSNRNSTHEFLAVAVSVLTKTADPLDIGRIVTPNPMIAGDYAYVAGYLLFDNGTPMTSKQVDAWWIKQDGTEIPMGSDSTDGTGQYNISYLIGPTEPTNVDVKVNYSAGSLMTSYILNATTQQDPEVKWAVNTSITLVTPAEVTRGITTVTIAGWIREKHNWLTPYETIYLTIDGQNIKDETGTDVTTVTDEYGYFSKTFIINGNTPINAAYMVNVTLTNSSFIYNQGTTGLLEVNCSTSISNLQVDRTGLLGENITISGTLVDELGQPLAGNLTLLANGSQVYSEIVSAGIFNWEFSLTDPASVGYTELTVWHPESIITYPSMDSIWHNVPRGADIIITNIAGYSNLVNLTLFAGSRITVSGTLMDNESSHAIFNRQVDLYYNNTLIGSGTTDIQGEFHIQITLPGTEGNTTFFARFIANNIYESEQISVEVLLARGFGEVFMQFLPWIFGAIAGLVVAIVAVKLYTRRTRNEMIKINYKGLNVDNMKAKLEALQQGKRYREAIIYAYISFLQVLKFYFNIEKRKSQTAREFAIDIVKKIKIPPSLIYPFTNIYEEARFGPREIDAQKFSETSKMFSKIYEQIQASAMPEVPKNENAA
ncbi:MAG: DUF4129 domain-containing transglutaminase family protein, partial [Candidatus Helarchaeota archaeon]